MTTKIRHVVRRGHGYGGNSPCWEVWNIQRDTRYPKGGVHVLLGLFPTRRRAKEYASEARVPNGCPACQRWHAKGPRACVDAAPSPRETAIIEAARDIVYSACWHATVNGWKQGATGVEGDPGLAEVTRRVLARVNAAGPMS